MSTVLLLLALVQADEPYQRFAAAYATLDADRVVQVYTEDALMLPPGGEILRGRAAIRERYARGFDADRERGHTRRITFELVDRIVSGDVRSDYGYYTIIGRSPEGHEDRSRGRDGVADSHRQLQSSARFLAGDYEYQFLSHA